MATQHLGFEISVPAIASLVTPQVSSRDALSSSEIDDETWFGFLTSHLCLPSEVQFKLLHLNSGRVSLGSRQWGPNCTNETMYK